jgi:hypothetical protein
MTNQKIMVGIDNEMVELVGKDKSAFLADRAIILEKEAKIKAEAEAKAQAKAELLERLGITADEANLLLA